MTLRSMTTAAMLMASTSAIAQVEMPSSSGTCRNAMK